MFEFGVNCPFKKKIKLHKNVFSLTDVGREGTNKNMASTAAEVK